MTNDAMTKECPMTDEQASVVEAGRSLPAIGHLNLVIHWSFVIGHCPFSRLTMCANFFPF